MVNRARDEKHANAKCKRRRKQPRRTFSGSAEGTRSHPRQQRHALRTPAHVHCKFTGIITYKKFAPPLSNPGRFGAVSSKVISSLSTTRNASTRNCGLNPISTSVPSYLHGKLIVASPASGERLVSTRPFLLNWSRTPLLSSVVSSDARRIAERKSAVLAVIFLSVSLGITSSYGGNWPSTRLLVSVA